MSNSVYDSSAFLPRTMRSLLIAVVLMVLSMPVVVQAAAVQVTVNVQNLAPTNSVSFTPLNLGFHQGIFDSFNIGQPANSALTPLAEVGDGSAWQSAFAAADATATLGTIGGVLQPGESLSANFLVDPILNPYFTFAAMAIPSNDFFIGNDSPTAFQLFDNAGNLQLTQINQTARQIWDAGSEVFDPATAAFLSGVDGSLNSPQNSVVSFNFAELAALNGLTTAAGYPFHSNLTADSQIYNISFEVSPVPEPQNVAMLIAGLLILVGVNMRRLQQAT